MFKLLLLALFSVSVAHAAEDKSTAAVKESLQKYEQMIGPISQVNKSPIPGLYEVIVGYQVFYTDEHGQYLIDGSLYDLRNQQNLSELRAHQLTTIDKLPLELAVKKVKGNGKRKLAYFTDPNCGWCKKLEHELQGITDVTLYLFMATYIGGNDSAQKNQAIWCSPDRVKAWDNLMINGTLPAPSKCDTPTAQVMELGKKLRIGGTPALIFANGVINPGYMPAAELEKALDSNQ